MPISEPFWLFINGFNQALRFVRVLTLLERDRPIKSHQDRSPVTLNDLLIFLFLDVLVVFLDAHV